MMSEQEMQKEQEREGLNRRLAKCVDALEASRKDYEALEKFIFRDSPGNRLAVEVVELRAEVSRLRDALHEARKSALICGMERDEALAKLGEGCSGRLEECGARTPGEYVDGDCPKCRP